MKKTLYALLSFITALILLTIAAFAVESPQGDTRHSTDFLSDHEFSHNLNMNSTTVRFESGETISILCGLNFDDSIQSYQASESGLHITSAAISDDEINVSLSFDTNALLHEIEIQCVTAHSESVSLCIYAIQTDRGIFISPISYQEAQVNYLADMFAENEITWEECEILLSQLYQTGSFDLTTLLQPASGFIGGENEIASTVSASISGTLQWYDEFYDSGDSSDTPEQHLHPIRNTLIKLFRTEGLLEIAETTSDNDGTFEFSFNANTDYTYYVRVYTGDQNAKVCNRILFSDYFYDYHADIPVSFNASHAAVCDFVATMGDADNSYFTQTQASGTMGRAFQISQAILCARDFADLMMGSDSPSEVGIVYPHTPTGSEGNAFYSPWEMRIKIADVNNSNSLKTYASWDMLMHEYGHHISHDLSIVQPGYGGSHSSNVNLADVNTNHSSADKNRGIYMAWQEAWPTIFGAIAQQKYKNELTNIYTFADNKYTSYNTQPGYSYENGCVELGECCEQSIMAILWDIFDKNTIDFDDDGIGLTYQQWWDVATSNQITTFSAFAQQFIAMYPSLEAKFNQLLSYYKMAPASLHSIYTNSRFLPIFSWDGQGGSVSYPNNQYILTFYTESGNEIMHIGDSETGRLTTNSYTLNETEWNQIVSLHTQNGVKRFYWNVTAYQSDTPETGPYESPKAFFDLFFQRTSVTVGTTSDTLDLANTYHWYSFTPRINGSYIFYTTGSIDTVGSLFTAPVYVGTTTGSLAYDDNSGTGNNFRFTIYLNAGVPYFLRVTNNGTTYGSYVLNIELSNHSHVYSFECTNYNATYHKAYCVCGASQLVAHNWMQVGAHRWECVDCGRTSYTDPLSLNLPEGLPEIPDAILPKAEWARAVS